MRIVIAFEHIDGKSGRDYTKVIPNYSVKSLKLLFNTKNEERITDESCGDRCFF